MGAAALVCRGSVTRRVLQRSDFEHRDSIEYKAELGTTIVSLLRAVPDGALVFFPTYSTMAACIEYWKVRSRVRPSHLDRRFCAFARFPQMSGMWSRICDLKVRFMGAFVYTQTDQPPSPLNVQKSALVETRVASELGDQIAAFNAAVSRGEGAVFFAVCRGKVGSDRERAHVPVVSSVTSCRLAQVSEGLDFADANGRAVMVTGLPFPPKFDPRVLLKRCLLDEVR